MRQYNRRALAGLLYGLDITTVRNNKKVEYINLPCGFDIETTSTEIDGHKTANMYAWAVGLGHDTPIFYGRKWSEFIDICEFLQDALGLHEKRLLVVYVHNLAYEFQFMREYFEWVNVFSLSERKPIKAVTTNGIEFRCSYILSGYNAENTAKNLVNHTVEKMVGDLDYSLIRHHETPLTELELGYIKNDIVIITAYIQEQIDHYGSIIKIPMTNTGIVRRYVRDECYNAKDKRDKHKYSRYRKLMKDLTLSPDYYDQMTRAFMGGFTHANANYVGLTLNNVSSVDFTSAYPSVMVAEKFPMSTFRPIKLLSEEHFNIARKRHALIFDVKFTNITSKIKHENYLSEHKCWGLVNATINNGRVNKAESLTTTITEIDFEIIERAYEWGDMQISNVHQARKNYLPKAIVKSILDMYQGKTELKDVEGSEVEYMLSKGMLNSVYGMSVTAVVKDDALYTDHWQTEPANTAEEIETYNESKNRFLYYPWGLWVTAYARRNLWTGILAVGDDYVYSDTDSMKLLNYENHKEYFEGFDNHIIAKMIATCKHHKLNPDLLSPKTKDGIIKTLGIWDFEGTYSHFKTLGAKRYLTLENDRLQMTVAGLSKKAGRDYLLELSNGDLVEAFTHFENHLYVPAHKTGKMTHTYIDEEQQYQLTDYLGNVTTVNTKTSVHLENCDFTMSLSVSFESFIKSLAKGELITGTIKA